MRCVGCVLHSEFEWGVIQRSDIIIVIIKESSSYMIRFSLVGSDMCICDIVRTYVSTQRSVRAYIRTYVRMYIRTYVLTYVRTYVCKYVRTYARTYCFLLNKIYACHAASGA